MIAHISYRSVTQIRYKFHDGGQNGDRKTLFYKGAYHEMLSFCLFFHAIHFFPDGGCLRPFLFLVYSSSFGRLLLLVFLDFAIFWIISMFTFCFSMHSFSFIFNIEHTSIFDTMFLKVLIKMLLQSISYNPYTFWTNCNINQFWHYCSNWGY